VSTAAPRRTGPRTTEGKRRSARNAFRHGLRISVLTDPVTAGAVEALAGRITQGAARDVGAEIAALARRVAQAQIDIVRIRRVRHELLATALRQGGGARPAPVSDHVSDLVSKVASRLATLDRYERRALARRKFAIRDFDSAAAAAASVPKRGRGQK
jgi:hypothetical protein